MWSRGHQKTVRHNATMCLIGGHGPHTGRRDYSAASPDGTVKSMATLQSTGALADDPLGGLITADSGIIYYLTRCCGASGKGSANSTSGVVCRSCYADVGPEFGLGWMVDDADAWDRYRQRLTVEIGERLAADLTERLRVAALARQAQER